MMAARWWEFNRILSAAVFNYTQVLHICFTYGSGSPKKSPVPLKPGGKEWWSIPYKIKLDFN
jgi:hypothetical protein